MYVQLSVTVWFAWKLALYVSGAPHDQLGGK